MSQARSARQIWELPPREEAKYSWRPSGEMLGSASSAGPLIDVRFCGVENGSERSVRSAYQRSRPPCPPGRSEVKYTRRPSLVSVPPESSALLFSSLTGEKLANCPLLPARVACQI